MIQILIKVFQMIGNRYVKIQTFDAMSATNTISIRCSVGVQTYIHMKLDAGNARRTT